MVDAADLQPELVRLRRELHRIPEVGLDLPRTQERVLRALQGLPLELSSGERCTSVTGVLRGRAGPGRTVLLRGDMDALPLRERTGLPYAAQVDRMHACGHDLHTAMLVGAAHLLSAQQDRLAGSVVFMFQPGEEGYDGADTMVSEGILDASGARADAAFALHVTSSLLPAGVFASRRGTVMAASDRLSVTVVGAGGHGSAPHNALDPITAACAMIGALQTFVTRRFDVFDPVVITVGSIQAGTAANVIPDEAVFEATIRSFSPHSQSRLLAECVQVLKGVAHAHGVEVVADLRPLFPVTVNDATKVDAAAKAVIDRFGEHRWTDLPSPRTASEDFSKILAHVPGAMVFLGAHAADADPRHAPSNHSPRAAFDDAVLFDGATLYADLAVSELGQPPNGTS